jgi:NADH:ubiquinone oxidoreductase subunit 4 (subunit M)
VLVAAFTLRALKQSFFGEKRVSVQQGRVAVDTDWNEQQSITLTEKIGACLLMFTTLAVGLYPKILLDRIMPAVENMRFLK